VIRNYTKGASLTSPVVAKFNAAVCELPTDDIGYLINYIAITMMAVAAFCILLRFATKIWIDRNTFGWDDYLLALVLVSLTRIRDVIANKMSGMRNRRHVFYDQQYVAVLVHGRRINFVDIMLVVVRGFGKHLYMLKDGDFSYILQHCKHIRSAQ